MTGTDKWGGLAPSQPRKDVPSPPHWRLEAVTATPRPHHLVVDPGGTSLLFTLDLADLGSDIWILDPEAHLPRRLTVDRPPAPFWEDTPAAVSPDGDRVAYVCEGWTTVVPMAGGPARRLVRAGSPVWTGDGRLVVTVDHPRSRTATELPTVTEVTRLAIVDPSDPFPVPVTPADADHTSPTASGTRIACVSHPPTDRNRSDVVVVDADKDPDRGERLVVASTPAMHAHSPAWSHDGATLAFVAEDEGRYDLCLVGADGARRRILAGGQGDFSSPSWSPDDTTIVAVRTDAGTADLVTVDVVTGRVSVLAGGGTWSDPVWLADGSVAAIHEDHATPARIEAVDDAGRRRVLYDPAPLPVVSAPHVTPERVVYRSVDGLEIPGFLFRPHGAGPEHPVPAVVYPHGGPTSHYGDEWDGHAQYFVDKGYAWFAINFRGSTSYGRDFERANHGVWGVADTGDCLAAADHLAGLGWVDPGRIAIFGASYGSYLALASLASDPDHRFACGVAKYGDSDIVTSWAQGDRGGVEDLERMMGHPAQAIDAYRAGSPIHRVAAIARPLLVAHGERDDRVHPAQSEELVRELERLGKTFEYVTYPTEGHGLLRAGPQLDFYRRLERFLDWYLM